MKFGTSQRAQLIIRLMKKGKERREALQKLQQEKPSEPVQRND